MAAVKPIDMQCLKADWQGLALHVWLQVFTHILNIT